MSTSTGISKVLQAQNSISSSTRSEHQIMSLEEEIIKAAKEELRAFKPLYEKYHEQIFRFVYQRVTDKEAAYDITSQVFLKAMQNISKYQFRGLPFSSWLYRIARNACHDAFKEEKATRALKAKSEILDDLFEHYDHVKDEQRVALLDLLADLSEADLELVEMRFFEERSFKEIGEITGMTENNAKVKVYRIIERMKKRTKT